MDFEEVYAKEFPVVYKYLLVLCGNQALAEELTQETFSGRSKTAGHFGERASFRYGCVKSGKISTFLSCVRSVIESRFSRMKRSSSKPLSPVRKRPCCVGILP